MKGLAGSITYETDIILPPACLFFERVPYLCNFENSGREYTVSLRSSSRHTPTLGRGLPTLRSQSTPAYRAISPP